MFTLYHNAASSCSQKVRWTFAEKNLEFESKEIDLLAGEQHADWYAAINPKCVVPSLVHGDQIVLESSLINLYLEDVAPGPALVPAAPAERYAMRKWVHRFDQEVHPVTPVLTFALGPRKLINAQPPEVREANIANIQDPVAREQRRSVLDHGVHAPQFKRALAVFIDLLDDMEATLQHGGWLAGDSISLADGTALPYALRTHNLGLDALVAARPAVADWLARMQARASYDTAVTQWLPAEIVELLRANGLEEWPTIEAMLAEA